MYMMQKRLTRGRRTAFRVYGRTGIVALLPRDCFDKEDHMFELSPEATYLWKLLENKPLVREVVASFMRKYKIARSAATRKVVKFVDKFTAEEMIEILDEGGKK